MRGDAMRMPCVFVPADCVCVCANGVNTMHVYICARVSVPQDAHPEQNNQDTNSAALPIPVPIYTATTLLVIPIIVMAQLHLCQLEVRPEGFRRLN